MKPVVMSHRRRNIAAAGLALVLAGCATTTVETFPTTSELVERTDLLGRRPVRQPSAYQEAVHARAQVLLAQPLTLDAALEIAMLNGAKTQEVYRHHRRMYPELVAEIAAARQPKDGAALPPVEWTALRAALLPVIKRTVPLEFADEYVEAAPAFIETAEHVREAWYTAVAARQIEAMTRQVADALMAEAELANEQYRAGTVARGEQAKRHLAAGAALKAHSTAKLEAFKAREALVRDLGLWAEGDDLQLPDRLPELPEAPPALDNAEEAALTSRLDLIDARLAGGAWAKAIAIRSEVREARVGLEAAFQTAKYQRDVVMPLARTSLEFAQQEYNGMLVGIYDLLGEVREQIEAGREYVETLRDYWIAEATFAAALGGSLPERTTRAGDVR